MVSQGSFQNSNAQALGSAPNVNSQLHSSYTFPHPILDHNMETSSPESQGPQSSGRYYVDGEGARLPHVGSILYYTIPYQQGVQHSSSLACANFADD